MKNFFLNVAATVLAAALIGNAAFLYRFGERLARIEAKLETLESKAYAKNTAHSYLSQ